MAVPNEGLSRFSGMYGAAYRGTTLLSDVIEVSGTVEVARIDVPLVGTTRNGSKLGRETREGTIRHHQMDDAWNLELYGYFSQSLEERRAARDAGNGAGATLRPFEILLKLDDPDVGVSAWRLEGVLITRMNLGFSISDDLIEREIPMTWDTERPVDAFTRRVDAAGQYTHDLVPQYKSGVRQIV
jgi:hypothetical protein